MTFEQLSFIFIVGALTVAGIGLIAMAVATIIEEWPTMIFAAIAAAAVFMVGFMVTTIAGFPS